MRRIVVGLACLALLGQISSLQANSLKAGSLKTKAHHHKTHARYHRIAPHRQPRRAGNPDVGIGPTAKEKALDSKTKDICRGC